MLPTVSFFQIKAEMVKVNRDELTPTLAVSNSSTSTSRGALGGSDPEQLYESLNPQYKY